MPNQSGFNPQWGPNQPPEGGWYGPPQQGQQPSPAPKRKKWPFIVFGIVTVLLVAVGVRIGYLVLRDKDETSTAQPAPPVTESASSSEQPAPPPKPGEPIPCDPDSPGNNLCFPDDFNPDAVMDGVASEGWSCFREGDRTESGSPVTAPRLCEAKDNVDQPYTIRAHIEYQRFLYEPTGKLWEFDIYASTSAAASRGEHTSTADPPKALIQVFGITAKHIWQGRPDLLKEATEAFEQLKPQCATPEATWPEGVGVTTPSGYEINCYGTGGGVTTGDATTYSQSLKIIPAS